MGKQIIAIMCLALGLGFATVTFATAANNYGALAYSPSTGAWGGAYDYASRRAAENRALSECRARGRGCQVAVWFRNACGAISVGNNGGWGSGWGSSRSRAEREARAVCRNYDSGCRAYAWTCTSR